MLVPRMPLRTDQARPASVSAEAASLRLHRNERVTTFRPAEHDAMTASISVDDLVRYPDQSATASAVAALFGVAEAQLSLYAGSESSVRAVFDVMVDPGDPVLCLRPAYRGYSREAFSHRADLRRVGYDNAMRLDVPALLDEVARGPRLVILGSPDALGQPLPRDVVPAVLAGLERGGALLVVDEAYHGFGAPTVVDLVSAHPQLVVLRTFSKAWGLAGVRCGVAIAHASTARLLNRVRLRNEVSGPTLAIVRYVLRHPELRDEYVRAVVSARDILSEIFAGLGFDVVGSMANFLVMRVPQPHTAETVCARALAAGIAIAAPLPDAVRVTIGPLERMQPLVEHVRSEYTSGGRGAA